MGAASVNPTASQGDKLVVTALVSAPRCRLPEIQISNNTDEQFGSKWVMPNWFWMDLAHMRATPQELVDSSFAIREFDFENEVFVRSVT
jgi:hypothetical protein